MTSTLMPAGALPQAKIFGEPQLHTDGDLLALTFAPDGSLWSIEEPGVLRHWDSTSGHQLGWTSLSDLETLWAISPDARLLASGSEDLTLWDASSGQVLTVIAQPTWVSALAFHKDPSFLATGHDDGVIRYWDASAHQPIHEFRLHKRGISALAFDSAGKVLAAAGEDKLISLWNLTTGQHLGNLEGHTDRIPALAWQPGTRVLVSAAWDSSARVWDTQKLQPIILLNTHLSQVTALGFSPDGNLLATADAALNVHVWDFAAKKALHVLTGLSGEARSLCFSPDGGKLACGGEKLLHLWDARTGAPLAGSGPRPTAPTRLALDRAGQRLAGNGGGSLTRIWSLAQSGQPVTVHDSKPVHALRFSPDGTFLAGAASDHVRLWDAGTGNPKLDMVGPETAIQTLAISPDGGTLAAAGSDGMSVWIYNTSDGEPILLIPDALDGCTIESLAFHPQGNLLAVGGIDWMATGGSNGAISIWDLAARQEVNSYFSGTPCLAFHPNGQRIAFATLEHSIGIWDIQAADLTTEHQGHEDAITALAWSPDGKWLASGGADRTIRLWDENGTEHAAFEVDSQVTDLAFSPDGQFLFSANANTTCYQFPVSALVQRGK